MEKKVLLNDLVGRGTHIRTEVTPKVVIADGSHPKGEIWDANKVVSAISQDNLLDESNFLAKLVSGTNIKTINNNSVLGSGNIDTNNVIWGFYVSGKFWKQPLAHPLFSDLSVEEYNINLGNLIPAEDNKLYIDYTTRKMYIKPSGYSSASSESDYMEVSESRNDAVRQIATSNDYDFPVLFSSQSNVYTLNIGDVYKSGELKFNPSTGNLQVTKINGVSADLTNYYTKSEVEALIAAALNPNSETPQEPVEQPGE